MRTESLERPRRLHPDVFNDISRREFITGGLSLVALLVACGKDEEARPRADASEEPWTFTDDRGRTVSLQKRPVRVVAQVSSAAALWDFGIRPVGIFGPQHRPDGTKGVSVGDVDLDAVESVGEQFGDFNLERLAALRPDLLVCSIFLANQLWYVPQDAAARVEEITSTIGISLIKRPATEAIARFGELAQALGPDLDAPEVVEARQRLDAASEQLQAATTEKPGLKVLFMSATPELMYLLNPPDHPDLLDFQRLGLNVVVPQRPDPGGYWETLSWERAGEYPADLILIDARPQALDEQALSKIPTWAELPAAKAGQVGPWRAEGAYSHKRFALILEELTHTVRASRDDIV